MAMDEERRWTPETREAFILAQQEWVARIARRYARYAQRTVGYEFGDLCSIGMIEVMEYMASGKYDPQRASFQTAATPWVEGRFQRELRLSSTQAQAAATTTATTHQPKVYTPIEDQPTIVLPSTDSWLRAATGERDLFDALNAAFAAQPDPQVDVEAEAIAHVDGLQVSETLRACLECLTENERRVIEWRFVSDLKQREIGERLGVTQQRVSALQRSAIRRLRAMVRQAPGGEVCVAEAVAEVDDLISFATRRRMDITNEAA